MIFYWIFLNKRKKTVNITIDGTFEKIQDKVTDIMGPLSKLWVMIENANPEKDVNASAVQMDTVLELLEKTVVLIGQCSNTIIYETRKNVLLGVRGTSTKQVAVMLKEKASFLQKHDKALFGKEFNHNLAETIKAKKQSIEAITEVRRPNNRQPFRGGPSQNKVGWGRDSTTTKAKNKLMVKCSSLKGIVPFHNISLPSPALLSMEVLTHSYPLLKHLFSKMAVPIFPLAGRLKHFLPAWRLLTKDQIVFSLVEGFKTPLLQEPKQMFRLKPQ